MFGLDKLIGATADLVGAVVRPVAEVVAVPVVAAAELTKAASEPFVEAAQEITKDLRSINR